MLGCVEPGVTIGWVRAVGSGTNESAKGHDAKEAWRLLESNPDYVADWRAHGRVVAHDPPPFPLRRQTVADLEAARWNLMAWEDPWLTRYDWPFWADVPMVEARVVDPAEDGGDALFRIVRDSGATFTGLWLRDGGLIIKVARRRKTEQVRVADAKEFDPARSGLEIGGRVDAFPRGLGLRRASVRREVAQSGGGRAAAGPQESTRRMRPAAGPCGSRGCRQFSRRRRSPSRTPGAGVLKSAGVRPPPHNEDRSGEPVVVAREVISGRFAEAPDAGRE